MLKKISGGSFLWNSHAHRDAQTYKYAKRIQTI